MSDAFLLKLENIRSLWNWSNFLLKEVESGLETKFRANRLRQFSFRSENNNEWIVVTLKRQIMAAEKYGSFRLEIFFPLLKIFSLEIYRTNSTVFCKACS